MLPWDRRNKRSQVALGGVPDRSTGFHENGRTRRWRSGLSGLGWAAGCAFGHSYVRVGLSDKVVGLGLTGSVRVAALVVAVGAAWVAGCGRGIQRAGKAAADPGRTVFGSYCAACHQYDGRGVGEAPPFEGSPWVTGPEARLIKIVLHGVRGAMVVDGKTYDREMPGIRADSLG